MCDLEKLGHTFEDRTDFQKKRSPAMHCFLPEQVAVFTELAENFGVSDTYFSSAPCQTWPNRLFAMCGHCYGYVNNLADVGETYEHDHMDKEQTAMRVMQFMDKTIFDLLLENGVEYSVYAGGFPLCMALDRQITSFPDRAERIYSFEDFKEHVAQGYVAPYTWIEPQYLRYGDSLPNDMHPPHNVLHPQKLVADIYNTLRSNEEVWSKTLFIVNCDEGVGVFDHVPPPKAVHPGTGEDHTFYMQTPPEEMASNPFNRYGTRTPCLLASPLLNPKSVVRPGADEQYPFDHCSVIRTVLDLFVGTDAYLTDRDFNAPSLAPQFLPKARADLGPPSLYAKPPPTADPSEGKPDRGRGGCHNVRHLMDMADESAEAEGGNETEGSGMNWLSGHVKTISKFMGSGYESHLKYNA